MPSLFREQVPQNKSNTTLAPQNDDVTAIHIEHYNTGRAGIAIDSRGGGDAIFIGLNEYSYYGLDIVAYPPASGDPAPAGPMIVLNNSVSGGQNITLLDILDYNAGYTSYADLRKTGSSHALRWVHSVSSWSGDFLRLEAENSSGTFSGTFLRGLMSGQQVISLQPTNPYVVIGPNYTSIGTGSGAPTYSAEGGSIYLRIDGSAGNRLYVNQAVGGFGTSWLPVSGV